MQRLEVEGGWVSQPCDRGGEGGVCNRWDPVPVMWPCKEKVKVMAQRRGSSTAEDMEEA